MACPNINSQEWKDLVKAQGVDTAYYLWDKYEGSVPEKFNKSLEDTLVDGFLKDFNITATEYKSLKEDIGLDAVAASDLLAKSIAYNEGENITPEVAYFAYAMLGKDNGKIRSDLKYLINKWEKYAERFNYHSKMVSKREGFIQDKDIWKNKVRDLVILDFLTEKLNQHYFNPKEFEKVMDKRWTREDFTLWKKIVNWFERVLAKFSSDNAKRREELENVGISVVDEILNRNYEYFDYKLADGQIQKYYNDTIASDQFAKSLVEYGQDELGIILTGSLAVRRAGAVYRTADETIHDIDWVVPYALNRKDGKVIAPIADNKGMFPKSKETRDQYLSQFDWFNKFKEKYPTFQTTNAFYGGEHEHFESLTVTGAVDGEFYDSDGYHEEEVSFYRKNPDTKEPIKITETQRRKHKKGDYIKGTGYVIDFFVRLQPKQEEHENYFKLWKEIFIAKLKMGRNKDFIDWKVFFPYLKSQDSFNFNYEGFRHIKYESSENYALEETNPITPTTPTEPSQESDNTNVFHSKSRLVKEQEDAKSIYFNEVYGKDLSENNVNRINSKLAKLSDRIGDQTWSLRESASGNLYIAGYKNGLVTSTDYYSPYANGIFRQTEGVDASTSSPETIDKVKEILKKIGVDIQDLVKYAKETGLDTKGVNGIADLTRKIIAIAEGKEGAALTEEMVHVATAIMEQLNPKMVTEMIAKIDRFAIYKKVLNAYKSDKAYQLPNGKPDIRKIKKEAVDKLIAELIINQNEGDTEFPELRNEINRSFVRRIWNDILDRIRGMYKKANINIFEEAAKTISTGELGAKFVKVEKEVQELFDANPELASIGTAEQYAQYLDSIFPNSKVKNVVYHASMTDYGKFKSQFPKGAKVPDFFGGFVSQDMGNGFYFADKKNIKNWADQKTKLTSSKAFFDELSYYKKLDEKINDWAKTATKEEKKKVISEIEDIAFKKYSGFEAYKNAEHEYFQKQFNFPKPNFKQLTRNEAKVFPYIINAQTINIVDDAHLSYINSTPEELKKYDSMIEGSLNNIEQGIVWNYDNSIYRLGDTHDIEGFKEFVKTAPATFKIESGVFKQKNTDIQEQIQAKILNTKNSIDKKEGDPNKTDPLLLDAEEANNFYEITNPDGTKSTILKRVTDRVKAWYADRFRDKTFTPQEQAFNELKREFGIQGHLDFEEIHSRYYNKDGTKRDKPGQRPTKFNLPSDEMYTKLENYYKELIKTFPKDTLIMSEVIIYDKKEQEAGTLDFLAIEPSGKAHILDWKFMHIKGDDVAWFKQGAFNIQLGRYKQILKDNYGITEFGMTRAIPISMEFKPKNKFDISLGFKLSGIAIGSVKASDIEELYLVPISEETESTGEKDLDRLIVKLNALLKQIEKEEVTEQEREFRIERLNTLRQTIRIVQATSNIAPLIDTIEVMRKEGDKLVNDYEITYKNRSASSKDSSDKDLSDFSDDMNNFISLSSLFTNIGDDIGHLIYNEEMKSQAKTAKQKEELADRREALDKLREESSAIYRARNEIKEVALAFADKHIGQRNLVTGLTRAEAVVKGLSSLFRGVSELPLASLNILYKVTRMAQGKASQDALVEVKELMAIREAIMKKGGDARKFIQQIYQKDKEGGIVNKLIYKYKEEFRKTVDDKFALGGDRKWLLENIDIEEYKKEALPVIKNRIEQIKKQVFPGTPTQVKAMKQKLMQEVLQKYDVTRIDFTGGDNYIIKRHPLPIWYSDEYKAISKDEDLSKLYEFIVKFNEKAKDVGYINNNVLKTFLPFVRKSMAEEISFNNVLSVMNNFGSNLQMKVETAGYGKINEITGAVENSVPKYYTHDFSRKEDGVNDYSDVSEDLFKNLILYVQQVNKYKYMTEVEGQLKLVKTVEEFKGHHLQTNQSGDVTIGKNGKPEEVKGNEENTRMYDDFLRVLLYDQKYVLSDADTPLKIGKVLNFVKSGVNKVAGREIWKVNEDASPTSLIKTMDAANRAFQVKTLGLEIIPGLVNLFGGQAQMSAQSGNYFKYKEFLSNERKIVSQEFGSSEEKEIFIQLMDVFMPMKDDPAYEEFKKAGLTKLTNANLGDMLMITMRFPEQIMEKATFLTLLQNSIVVDGKIVNIREYVKSKYKGRSASSTSYKESKEKIEKEVEELKKTKSIAVTRKLENGKLIIPGLDISNRTETQRLTNLTRRISRNAMGGVSDGDINRMSMSVWTKSMMVFKGWIPKLADTRFSELRKISDDFSVEIGDDGMAIGEKYDIGRLRLLGYVMMTSFRDKASNIRNIIQMNDAGIAAIDKLYTEFAEKYKKRTGEDFNMSKDDFTDMVRANLGNQLKELAILAALIGATLAMGFMAPPDDADKATKNFYRYSQKVVDKFVSEISFFYNPIEFEKILSGSMFPAIGLITDMTKFFKHFWLQTTGLDFDADTSFDDVRKKAQPIKYGARVLPLFKSIMTYGSILSSDFAKEFDITIQRQSNIR